MQDIDYRERDREIREGRKNEVPQTEMGRRLKITRQRVQQIERRLGLGLRRVPGVYKEYTFKCKECGKKVVLKLSGRIYCSRECFFKSRKIERTSEEIKKKDLLSKKKNRLRSRKYYYEVFKNKPDWREIVKGRNEKYAKKK